MIRFDDPDGKLDKALILITSSTPRFSMFEMSVEALNAPGGCGVLRTASASLVWALNDALSRSWSSNWTRCFMIDDDHQFDADILIRLLQHDLPIVCALTCRKTPPFSPVMKRSMYTDARGAKRFNDYTWSELRGKKGLLPVLATGRSGMLIKREVFEKIGEPYWRQGMFNTGGQIAEDLDFCLRAKENGYETVVDLDTTFGHIDPVAVWPHQKKDGAWTIGLQWGDGAPITLSEAPLPPVT
jgi:hypothetical protein